MLIPVETSFVAISVQPAATRASGIVGIERKLEENRRATDKNISVVSDQI